MQYFTFIVPLLFWATFSHASPVTWEINAAITKLNPDMVGYANIGDVITLRYTFENTTPDIEPSVIERGKYDNAVTSASILLKTTKLNSRMLATSQFSTILLMVKMCM